MLYLIIGAIILVVIFIVYKIRSADTIENEAEDLAKKEDILKVAIYKDVYNLLTHEGMQDDEASALAAGVLMIFFNQNLNSTKTKVDKNLIMETCWQVFTEAPDIKDMVLTFLRTKYVIHAGTTGELLVDIDSPTGELMTKYGTGVPEKYNYNTFWAMFNKFMSERWG